MGYIKEPKGVDFVVQSEPLTNEERAAISEFIRKYKEEGVVAKKVVAKKERSIKKKQFA